MARKSRVIRTKRSETTRKRKEDEALESLRKGSKAVSSVAATTAVRQAGSSVAKKTGSTAKQKYTNNSTARTGSQTSYSPASSSGRTRERTTTRRRSTTAENMEKYMGSGKSGGRRQQTAEVKEKRTKTAERIAELTKGNLKQTAGSHKTTFSSIRNPNEEAYTRAAELRAKRGEKNNSPFSEGQYGQLVSRERTNKTQREKDLKEAAKLIDEGAEDIERGKKGLGKAGKFAADVYGAGLGIATDALAGPAATASMFSRSFGGAYKSAKDEGATDGQAALYGASIGTLEAATEKMFAVAKPLQKLYGKGAADDLTERVISKMASRASTQGGKDLAYHGGKVFASAVTEGLEEMVAEGLDPVIANQIYANALGTPHERASLQDLLYSGAVGGVMGGVLGGAGQVVDYRKGRSVRNVFGDDGIKKLADAASQVDDEAKAVQAQAMTAMIGSGESLAAGQVKQLSDMVDQQNRRDAERNSIARASAESLIRKEGYISPSRIDETGQEMMREHTHNLYESAKKEAADVINASFAGELQLPDAKVTELSEAISAIRTGVAGAADVNLFTTANPEARTVYEAVTGEILPETNGATREYIFRKIAENRLDTAKMETEIFVDEVKGLLQQDIIPTYEASGQEAFSAVMKDINVGNAAQVEDTIVTFEDFYNAGRSGISYAQISSYGNPAYDSLSGKDRMAAWEAGQKDYFAAQGVAKGAQVRLGEKVALSRSAGHSGARKGKLISELSRENKKKFTASEQMVFRTLARTFNINIHIVDKIEGGANGIYIDGEVYLSMSGDRNLFYIFSHEITHHMETFAPEEHFKLKELIRQRWTEQGGIEKAISQKIDHYNQFGKALSREDALDEIIADSTYEMIQDEGFVDELCRADRGLAQAILDAIKALISKVRDVLTFGDQFKPAQNEMLLSNLDILKEAQKLWVDGLVRAAENRDAVGSVSELENVVRFSLKEFVDGKRFVEVDGDTSIFDGLSEREQGTLATKIIKEKFAGKVIGIDNKVFVNGRGAGEYGFPAKKLGTTEHDAKMRAASELDNIVDAGFNFRNKADGEDGHTHKDVVGGFDYFDAIFKLGDKYFQGVINIKNVKNGKLFKDLTKIKDVTEDISSSYGENPKSTFLRTSSIDSISEGGENSNIKFSFAGESALNADNRALQKAREMYDDFESGETIRKETGWHRGDDGKWRFELDDSQMKVHKNGDALYRKENPEYVSFQELYGKFFDGSLTEEEQKEWTELNKVYGSEYSRLRKRLESGKARLEDILEHDVLFDNYPMLGRVKVKLDDLGEGIRGTYNPGANVITLDRKLFEDSYRTERRDGTLIHEIQHAIQEIEGFSGGASPEQYRDNLADGMTENEMYRYTAGEVEARDAANRQGFDAEQRRNMRPDIDGPVILAEDYIKYSLPDADSMYEYVAEHPEEFPDGVPVRDYEREAKRVRIQTNEELMAQIEKLKKDKRFTHGKVLDKKSVREEMNSLIKILMSISDGTPKKTDHELVETAVNNAVIIFNALKNEDYPAAANTAYHAAVHIVENLHIVDDRAFREYKELRNYLRGTPVTISEQDRQSIPDFGHFRRENMGRLRIVNEGGVPVDTLYAELCEVYPELFDEAITHPADQLMAMAEVRQELEPYDVMLSEEETEQLIKTAAQDLLDISATGKPWKSWADKKKEVYDEKLARHKARHKEAMRDVKIKERMRATRKINAERAKARDKAQRQKLHKEHRKRFGSIEKNAKWLSDRLLKPTDDKHIPEQFKAAVAHLLQQLDLQTERSKKLEAKYGKAKKTIRMEEMRKAYAELAKEDDSGIFEYDGYVFDLIDALGNRMDDRSVDEMSNEDLRAIDILLKSIVANIRNYNKAFSDNIKEEISEIGDAVISKAAARKKKRDRYGSRGFMDTVLNESMVTPRDFFEQLGGGMETVFMEMRKGLDQHIDNLTITRAFFEDVFKKYNNKKKPGSKIEDWRSDKQIMEIPLESGKNIKLTPAQMMSFYCLSKRKQAMGHIMGSGIVASRVDTASRLKKALGAKIEGNSEKVFISYNDVQTIIGKLTEEQIELADRLQDFLNNECAEWGNTVSMKMYGYRKFGEKNYFPIKAASTYTDSNADGTSKPTESIKNGGFTKAVMENANNPIMIDDIFKVVSDHINKMSLYNAFAAPISDFMRVYNYKPRDVQGRNLQSVKEALSATYGSKVIKYIEAFMEDVNGVSQTRTEGLGRFVTKSLANYKKATIGFNFRVALQQPTAVMRAFISISPKYFVNGSINAAKNLKDMKEHCQIARWKSWGHNQVDMARDIDDIMMNAEWTRLDVITMKAYGALDNITWSTIWAAVRRETKVKHPDVEVDSEEFYRICNERASEIFDKTQVVDSVFHKSHVMRRNDPLTKMFTSFMAEPTRTFNMVRSELVAARELWESGERGKAVVKANKAASVFVMNAALCAAAAAIADALRGKDADGDGEEDGWLENFLANFWDNVNPVNMIPVAKDIWGFKDGWGTQNMALEGYEALVQSIMGLVEADDRSEAIRKLAESMGLVFGIPVKNALREWETICDIFGINAFAGEIGGEEETRQGILTRLNRTGSDKQHTANGSTGGGLIKDGSWFDNMLNKAGINLTEEEAAQKASEEEVAEVESKLTGLSGVERQDKIWSTVTYGYTKRLAEGDFESIDEMRRLLDALGGDVEKFDESVKREAKSAFKKTIGVDASAGAALRDYLISECGYTEEKISSSLIAESDTAIEFQKELCLNDFDGAVEQLRILFEAGLTEEDVYVLYATRNSALSIEDYSTGELINPVEGTITSGFGYREAPTAGASTYHTAVDIGASEGTPVVAADGGKVTSAGWNGGYGISVTVDHGDGRYTIYNHLSGRAVQKGDVIAQGQELGRIGSTGISTGPHLDFQVRINGEYVDPMNYIGKYYN